MSGSNTSARWDGVLPALAAAFSSSLACRGWAEAHSDDPGSKFLPDLDLEAPGREHTWRACLGHSWSLHHGDSLPGKREAGLSTQRYLDTHQKRTQNVSCHRASAQESV